MGRSCHGSSHVIQHLVVVVKVIVIIFTVHAFPDVSEKSFLVVGVHFVTYVVYYVRVRSRCTSQETLNLSPKVPGVTVVRS